MREFKTRELIDKEFLGESVSFVASNDRIRERVSNISHESHMLEKIAERIRYDDVFWDVGACLGIHTFIVANFVPYGQVISFEPAPSNRGILVDNKSVNSLDNVTVRKEALSNVNEIREFAIRESVQAGYGRHSFTVDGDYDSIKTIDVDSAKGDDIDAPIPNIVKIDVEGAGPLVIEGMKDILNSDECHTVIVETHEPNEVQPSHEDFGYTEEEFIQLIKDCGFEVDNLHYDYHYIGVKQTDKTDSLKDDRISIVQSDISEMKTDAIVNSAGTTLRMGTGVAGSLRDEGGEVLNESAILKGPVNVGEAVRTKSFELDAEYIYHAASMPHYDNGKSTPQSVESSLIESLNMAESDGVNSISIPLIGCGLGGVPVTTGSRVIRDVLKDYEFDSLKEINIVAYTDDEYKIVERIFS